MDRGEDSVPIVEGGRRTRRPGEPKGSPGSRGELGRTARKSMVATTVAAAVVVAALAIWKLRLVVTLVFLAMIIAAAMRPGVEALRRRGVPAPIGVLLHYTGFVAVVALFLWFAVPRALSQVEAALGHAPTSRAQLRAATAHSTGIKHEILLGIQKELRRLPSAGSLLHPALSITAQAFDVLVYFAFVFACAAYWVFERDRAVDLVTSLIPRQRRKKVRDTFDLVDAKLGAFVRGEIFLVLLVSVVLSLAFWLIGEPYWILIGPFAGVMELVPVIGPLVAGGVAIGVGATASWQVALGAGVAVLVVRLLEDYLVSPRVFGHAVGLSPFLIIVSVLAVKILFGGFAVLLAIPIVAVLVTVVDVTVRGKDPDPRDAPAVLVSKQEIE